MAKQVIEIECPKGTKAVFNRKTQRIEFIPISDPKEKIHTLEDAIHEIFPNESVITFGETVQKLNLSKFIELQVVLKALNGPDFKWSLTEDTIWYPWVRFVKEDSVKNERFSNEEVIAYFKYKGTCFALMGGSTSYGGLTGLGYFNYHGGVGSVYATISFLSCKDEETAKYVSKKFGKLVFEAVTAFKLEDIEWID